MSTTSILLLAILGLGFLITFQIAKASEYVSILKGEKKAFEQNNKINGFLMMVFLALGLIGIWWCHDLFYDKTLLPYPSASDHGEKIDTMMFITIAITGVVFFITQILLFWFSYKYQHSDKRKGYFYPHNSNWEMLWTTIPAITLCILVGFGLYYWYKITGDAPKDSMQVEITGKQFGWIYRYPGKDNIYGKKYYKNIDEANSNELGLIWEDEYSHDDIVTSEAMYLVKDKPVKINIFSRDVIHSVGLPHFRMKMDAVPGTPTTIHFTPKYTTEEMREITKNPNFEYEIACDQLCGSGHYSMKGIVKVVTQSEFILWRAKQRAKYLDAVPENNPSTPSPNPADTTTNAAPVALNK
ncbi:MAG TPA: cytochrome c oxidase subunit II [Flavitalea sp.]|nr:cytochrome c oxidase subunit II [Flavitalea sp.]